MIYFYNTRNHNFFGGQVSPTLPNFQLRIFQNELKVKMYLVQLDAQQLSILIQKNINYFLFLFVKYLT